VGASDRPCYKHNYSFQFHELKGARSVEVAFQQKPCSRPYPYTFEYNRTDRSISPRWRSEPLIRSGLSLCAGNLIVELGDERQILECWGYFPREAWRTGTLTIPLAIPAQVFVPDDISLLSGVSARVPGAEHWVIVAVDGMNWIYFGTLEIDSRCSHAFIAEGLICSLALDRLVGLWLLVDQAI